jgi:hypothetical protein
MKKIIKLLWQYIQRIIKEEMENLDRFYSDEATTYGKHLRAH